MRHETVLGKLLLDEPACAPMRVMYASDSGAAARQMTHAIRMCGNDICIVEATLDDVESVHARRGPFDIVIFDSASAGKCAAGAASVRASEAIRSLARAHIVMVTGGYDDDGGDDCEYVERMGTPVKHVTRIIARRRASA
jgi:hypothetical protein